MLVKALGVLDFIGGLILIFGIGIKIPYSVLLFFGIIFLIKAGIGLLKDFASWIDLANGAIFILLIFFPVTWLICLIGGAFLIQKGIFSFL
jgi:hypothetical protein